MPNHHDPLWGAISLDEPVKAALVQSGPVQRLRGIAQAGASAYLYPGKAAVTRFDHSLGVMHVLATLGAGLEEQIAGLLHDIPHTAFSHTIDQAFPSAEFNFHEHFHHEIVMRSEIPQILLEHGIGLEAALEPNHFPLLEQPLPLLCADRLDYTLRDRHVSGHLTVDEAAAYMGHLVPTEQGIIHADVESALWFAAHFAEANRISWTAPNEAGAYWALGNAVKRAVQIGCLARDDLFTTDVEVMSRLRGAVDAEIASYLSLLEPATCFYTVENDGPCFETQMKQRVIDPLVQRPGASTPEPLSHLSPIYARLLANTPTSGRITYRLWSDSIPPLLRELYRDMSLTGETR